MKCDTITVEEYRALVSGERRLRKRDRYGSNARRVVCAAGHAHASALEGRVCFRLGCEVASECGRGATVRVFHQPRFPLLAIDPGDDGRPLTFTPDFALWRDGKLWRVVEAKSPGRVSRDFPVRRRAFEATYGVAVEVVAE